MKKFLLAVTALLTVQSFAQSTTGRENVLAQFTTAPLAALKRPGVNRGNKTQVVIYGNGEVIGYTCQTYPADKFRYVLPAPCPSKKLETLSKKEVRNLEALVEAARDGVMKDNGPVLCEAIPTRSFSYTADNGVVTLMTGSGPCGHVDFNDAAEAKELVKILQGYMNQYTQGARN